MIRKIALWSVAVALPVTAYAGSLPDLPPLDGLGAVVRDISERRAEPVKVDTSPTLQVTSPSVAKVEHVGNCPNANRSLKVPQSVSFVPKMQSQEFTALSFAGVGHGLPDKAELDEIKRTISLSLDEIVAPALKSLATLEIETHDLAVEALEEASKALDGANLDKEVAKIVVNTKRTIDLELKRVERVKRDALKRLERELEREKERLVLERERLAQRLERLTKRREREIERGQRHIEREIKRVERALRHKERQAKRGRAANRADQNGIEVISYQVDTDAD